MVNLIKSLLGGSAGTVLILILLAKPALILLALSWMGVSVQWLSVMPWLGAILLTLLTE